MSHYHLLALLSLAAQFLPLGSGFSFNTSVPTQCGNWTVNWTGGTAPFYLILVPTETVSSGRIVNVSIPTGLSSPYSHTFQLNEPAGLNFLATMYDSRGFGTGGTTGIMTVGSSSSGDSSCLDNNLLYDFFFSTDPQNSPSQCSSTHISWNDNVTYPLNLYGLIPFGTAFNIPVPQQQGSASIDWTVDIADGSQFLLFMNDAGQYQTGGSTTLLNVTSGNTNCMNSSSPHAGGASSSSGSGSGGSSNGGSINGVGGGSSGGANDSSGGSGGSGGGSSHTGAIVGGTLAEWPFCGERRGSGAKSYGFSSKEKTGRNSHGDVDLLGANSPARQNSDGSTNAAYTPMPFRYPSPEAETPGRSSGYTSSNSQNRPMQHMGGASAAMLAAAAGSTNEKQPRNASNPPSPIVPTHQNNVQSQMPHPAYADSNHTRPSSEDQSRDTRTTGLAQSDPTHTTNTSSQFASGHAPSSFPAYGQNYGSNPSGSEMGQSDVATVGNVARSDSTRKTGVTGSTPSSGMTGRMGQMGHEGEDSPGGTRRPLPEVPMQFVQHQDSGPIPRVVDLPPRYDQLRAQNPDQ